MSWQKKEKPMLKAAASPVSPEKKESGSSLPLPEEKEGAGISVKRRGVCVWQREGKAWKMAVLCPCSSEEEEGGCMVYDHACCHKHVWHGSIFSEETCVSSACLSLYSYSISEEENLRKRRRRKY